MRAQVHPVVKIDLTRNGIVFDEQLGTLLHLVDETGSVQSACQKMDLSLPSGWYLLAQAEDALGFPLLGNLPDRTVLTEKGRKLMDGYDGFRAAVQAKAEALLASFLPTETTR